MWNNQSMLEIDKITTGPFATNTYFLVFRDTDKVIIIDPATSEVKSYVENNSWMPIMIINTHGHLDHISGNRYFSGVPILIHEKDALMLSDPTLNLSANFGEEIISPAAERLLRDGDTIEVEGMFLNVIHTPGHTPGSICLKIGNVLFTGDTLFAGSIGRTDLLGGDYEELQKSLRKLMSLPDEIIIYPGHGEPTTIGKERTNNPYLCSI